jgi:hypothetical protein
MERYRNEKEDLLYTDVEDVVEAAVTELKTIPQILSTQVAGVPVWAVGSMLFVAQGMVIQSVAQLVPTTLPAAGEPPVILNDIEGVFTKL